ncbi:hypothetical protein DYB25_009379 [Aphanomyces astaci]|uniref:PDEase domain-containing protein n=1 Tax=Aphanomyces astaci TaxID=112090 RepID=A0A397DYH7_APHAT|nr:hypothetical protein DYB25_009379 [Aphanomyces astaci]RHY52698.1 hypothetical protein DYB34_009796 [Aphanomyces astaci]RHY70278.1 hypothetical protein DYB38_010953 [Aphanomyces astaci]RHY75811.1 hypothetical protein DYB30_002175 [Aphanomyces astaci]RHY81044.1 hypothetical protein DYB31_014842 [Aphanomyces astaci]
MAVRILVESGTTAFLRMEEPATEAFCSQVASMYQAVPYHNFKHAFSVMHTTYLLLQSYIQSPFTPLEVAALLLAALCHDIQHNGRTSSFHQTTKSALAREYASHKGSVLEAMHASVAIDTMTAEHVFDHVVAADADAIKSMIQELILATDMALHPQVIQAYADKKSSGDSLTQAKMILHCADISNPTKSPEVAKWWSHAVLREFCMQVDEEQKLQLPVSGFMKADLFSREEANMHLDFVDSFAVPAWRLLAVSSHFDEYVTRQCMTNIVLCRKMWLAAMEPTVQLTVMSFPRTLKRTKSAYEDMSPCGDDEKASSTKRRCMKKVVRRSGLETAAVDVNVT